MITNEQAQLILDAVIPYDAASVVTLRQQYGNGFVDAAIALMLKLGGPSYFDDAVRQIARTVLQPQLFTLAKHHRQRGARLFYNPMNRRKPMSLMAHRKV